MLVEIHSTDSSGRSIHIVNRSYSLVAPATWYIALDGWKIQGGPMSTDELRELRRLIGLLLPRENDYSEEV